MLRLGGLVKDLDDRNSSGRSCYQVNISNGEHETDHEGELHNAVQSHSGNHAMRDSRSWSFDFVTHMKYAIKTGNGESYGQQSDTPCDSWICPAAQIVGQCVEDEVRGTASG